MESENNKKTLILVVDDNKDNIKIVGTILRNNNYNVTYATSGEEALKNIKHDIPTLILLDIMMPDMSGYEVCRRLKRDIQFAGIPVIFLSAKSQHEDIVEGFNAGGVDYVTKPFNAAELLARVNTHVQLHQLKSLLSICSYCKKVRLDTDWVNIETYIQENTSTTFSHGLCPTCLERTLTEENI